MFVEVLEKKRKCFPDRRSNWKVNDERMIMENCLVEDSALG